MIAILEKEITYRLSIMSIVDGPPSSKHLAVGIVSCHRGRSTLGPRLLASDKVDNVYAGLEVSVGWDVRIVGGGCDVVSEVQAIVVVLEVHVQQTLICSVERNAPLRHRRHRVIVAHIRGENHHSSIE